MNPNSYVERRGKIEDYFDRTAVQVWARLTSDAPVGCIRTTVRAGRDRMRDAPRLAAGRADWPSRAGRRLRHRRARGRGGTSWRAGAGINLSPTLVDLARDRQTVELTSEHSIGRIEFRSGDMLDPSLGEFDYVVGMDSLIHYQAAEAARVIAGLAQRTRRSILFTYAPSNPALVAFRAICRLLPRGDRAPWIEPVAESALHRRLAADPALAGWERGRTQRNASGFYTSQAQELVRR